MNDRPLPGRFHLFLDACHFLQANLVDLLCRQVQRRELLDHGLIVGLTVGHRGRRERGASLRRVLGAHEGEEPLVCRSDGLTEHRLRLGAQRRLVRLGDARGYLRERRIQRIGGVALDVRLDRLVTPHDRHARHRKTTREAGPHVGDLLVEVARHVAKTAQIGAIAADGDEALARREVGPEEGVAIEGRFVGPELDLVRERVNGGAEDLRVHLLLRREIDERNAVQRRQRSRPVGQPRLLRRGINPGEAIARTRLAGLIAPASHLLSPPIPLFGVEGSEPGISGPGVALRLGRGRHEHEDAAEKKESQMALILTHTTLGAAARPRATHVRLRRDWRSLANRAAAR